MLLATVLALVSAVLHAGWNLVAKRSGDPYLALWGQFLLAGAISAVLLLVFDPPPAAAWWFAAGSAACHVPYVVALGWAYRHGDFSLAYPIARGGGALLAAIGGVLVLGDDLSLPAIGAIVVVVSGMVLLAWGASPPQVVAALIVASSIGGYTLFDSHAAREYQTFTYVFASHVASAIGATITGVAMGRGRDLLAIPRLAWARMFGAAVMTVTAYGLVLFAVRRAPVGYVAALRESSVLIAVLVGSRLLGEGHARIRAAAAAMIFCGLVLLVVAR